MTSKKRFTTEEARQIGESLGIDWSKFDVEQYRIGLDIELEPTPIQMLLTMTQ